MRAVKIPEVEERREKMWSLLFLHLILLDVGGEVLGQIGVTLGNTTVPPGDSLDGARAYMNPV